MFNEEPNLGFGTGKHEAEDAWTSAHRWLPLLHYPLRPFGRWTGRACLVHVPGSEAACFFPGAAPGRRNNGRRGPAGSQEHGFAADVGLVRPAGGSPPPDGEVRPRDARTRIDTATKQASDSAAAMTHRIQSDVDEQMAGLRTRVTNLESSDENEQTRIASLQQELTQVSRRNGTPVRRVGGHPPPGGWQWRRHGAAVRQPPEATSSATGTMWIRSPTGLRSSA